jgi:hypothetical protein
MEELKGRALVYVAQNFKEIKQSDEWTNLDKDILVEIFKLKD